MVDFNEDLYIEAEKKRIKDQKAVLHPLSQDGFFALGTVYLNIPPSQISVTDEAKNFRYSAIRQPGEVVATSGRNTTRIDLDIVFNGINDINTKLRPLLAQLKTVPFIQIENEYVRAILNPNDSLGKGLSYAESVENFVKGGNESQKLLNDMLAIQGKKGTINSGTLKILDSLKANGSLSSDNYIKVLSASQDPDSVPLADTSEEDWVKDESGVKHLDFAGWTSKRINPPRGQNPDLQYIDGSLKDLGAMQKELNNLKSQEKALGPSLQDERFRSKSIVCVLSQMSISTIQGFPETLSCRMSLFVFNYDPFSIDFGYISGYNKNNFTTDLTSCDLFIDWYTKRWLTPGSADNPHLEEYGVERGEELVFRYYKKVKPINIDNMDNKFDLSKYTLMEELDTRGKMSISGISVTLKNVVQFLPILSYKYPTCQYLGNMNSDVKIIMETVDLETVRYMNNMVNVVRKLSREENRVTRNSFIYIKNSLFNTLAMKFFSLDNFVIDTVPGNPGLYSMELDLLEYKPGQAEYQKLKREGLVTSKEIRLAAEFIIRAANKYAVNMKLPAEKRDPTIDSYKPFYNQVLDKDNGWFRSGNGNDNPIIETFYNSGAIGDPAHAAAAKAKIASVIRDNKAAPVISTVDHLGDGIALTQWKYEDLEEEQKNADLKNLAKVLSQSLSSDPEGKRSLWEDNISTMVDVAQSMERDSIIPRLRDTYEMENQGLNEYLRIALKKTPEDMDRGKVYCYPDLELPRYADLPTYTSSGQLTIGYDLMNKKGEAGQPRKKGEDEAPAQTQYSEVDPDFFYYKGSMWKFADGKTNSEANIGIRNALSHYKSMGLTNKDVRKEPILEQDLCTALANREGNLSLNKTIGEQNSMSVDKVSDKTQAKELSPETIKNMDGAVSKVNAINSGGEIAAEIPGGAVLPVVIDGYTAPRGPILGNDGKIESPAEPGWKETNDYMSTLVPVGTNVRVILNSGTYLLGGKIYGATVIYETSPGSGKYKSVADDMIRKFGSRTLKRNISSSDPLSSNKDESFRVAGETWVKAQDSKSLVLVVKDSLKTEPTNAIDKAVSGAVGSAGDSMGSFLGKAWTWVKGLATTSAGNAADVTKENFEVVTRSALSMVPKYNRDLILNTGKFIAGEQALNIGENMGEITSDIDSMMNYVTKPTPNNGLKRFDREAESSIEMLSGKILEAQKDDTLRMSRAFPTYKLYFIEEDMPEWGRFDDLYSYQAITSIDITRSRTDAVDVAVITFLNTLGTLDRSLFGLYNDKEVYFARAAEEAYEDYKQETKDEQTLTEFVLQAGTVIKIKMGYCSDPDLLDTVFTGVVAEVGGGDVITVVAQGFGAELMQMTPKPKYRASGPYAFSLLNKLITSPEIKHFGKLEWLPQQNGMPRNNLSRRQVWDGKEGRYVESAWYRRFGTLNFALNIVNNQSDDNIWMPGFAEHMLYRFCHGGWYDFITQNKTVWDVFRNMQMRMPGYITTVVPFDNRATIYFGPSDFMYWYTAEKKSQSLDNYIAMRNNATRSRTEKVKSLIDNGMRVVSSDYVKSSYDKLSAFLTSQLKLHGGDESYRNKMIKLTKDLPNANNNNNGNLASKAFVLNDLSSQTKDPEIQARLTDVASSLSYKTPNGIKGSIKGNKNASEITEITGSYSFTDKVCIEFVPEKYNSVMDRSFTSLLTNEIPPESNKTVWMSKEGNFLKEDDAIDYYDKRNQQYFEESNPSRKLIRNYHFKDSFHHIIGNSIVATSEYLSNRVIVEFGNEAAWNKSGDLQNSSSKFQSVTAQVDDDIWAEKIKTKIINERNAREPWTAWNYAQGYLSEEFRKMYGGHLVICGDPSIKPYDIVFIGDYFTDIFGPVEVEQVNHHFSQETGFVTTIVPNLYCHVNNTLQQGSLTVAGAYMDSLTKGIEAIQGNKALVAADLVIQTAGLGLVPTIRSSYSRLAFWASSFLNTDRRESMSFSPLYYAGRPYISGVEGMRKTSLYEALLGTFTRFAIQNARIMRAVSATVGKFEGFISKGLSDGRMNR
jgi:hypothetical protein